MGAVGLNKIARFRIDPRDNRTDDDYFELVGDDNGVLRLHVVAGVPRRLPEVVAARNADRVHPAQDGEHRLEVTA